MINQNFFDIQITKKTLNLPSKMNGRELSFSPHVIVTDKKNGTVFYYFLYGNEDTPDTPPDEAINFINAALQYNKARENSEEVIAILDKLKSKISDAKKHRDSLQREMEGEGDSLAGSMHLNKADLERLRGIDPALQQSETMPQYPADEFASHDKLQKKQLKQHNRIKKRLNKAKASYHKLQLKMENDIGPYAEHTRIEFSAIQQEYRNLEQRCNDIMSRKTQRGTIENEFKDLCDLIVALHIKKKSKKIDTSAI